MLTGDPKCRHREINLSLNIAVCAKQVVDPDTPVSGFQVDSSALRVIPAQGIPPVVNGYDENAVEAALKIREEIPDTTITIISVGSNFVMDVMKKTLSMGADTMTLVDIGEKKIDAYGTAKILSKVIDQTGNFDLIICGQQASDWDNAHVPLGIAEMLDLPSISSARNITVHEGTISVHSTQKDGYDIIEADLPALITTNSELGEPRYPTLRGIMQASRKNPQILTMEQLGLTDEDVAPKMVLSELFIPKSDGNCEIIQAENEEDLGPLLAARLRENKII